MLLTLFAIICLQPYKHLICKATSKTESNVQKKCYGAIKYTFTQIF